MGKVVKPLTSEQKLELAKQLNARFDVMCAELGALPEPEVMVLALYARTHLSERQALLVGGIR